MQELARVRLIKEQAEPRLLAVKGVVGVGVGKGPDGAPCVKVYVDRDSARLRRKLAGLVEGARLEVEVVGEIIAY